MNIFWGHHNAGLFLGVITMHFSKEPILNLGPVILGSFFTVNVQKGDSLWELLPFQIIWGMPDIPDCFGVNGRCWVQAYV